MPTKKELEVKIEELREALLPFAQVKPGYPDMDGSVLFAAYISYGRWRRAREVLGLKPLKKVGYDAEPNIR